MKFLLIVLMLVFPSSVLSIDTYFLKKVDLTTTSVTVDFGFPAKIIQIQADSGNADEICVDWKGSTAVCPAANTAGDDVIPAGVTVTVDGYRGQQVSLIAASGTLTFYIRAWE